MEIAFLAHYRSHSDIAMFSVALSYASFGTQMPMLLVGALLPHIAQRSGAGDKEGIRRAYRDATRYMAVLSVPAGFALAAFAPQLVPWLYGEAFGAAVPSAILLATLSSLGFVNAGSALIYGLGRPQVIVAAGTVGAALSVLGASIAVPTLGPFGAACSRSFAQACMIVFGTWYIWERLRCPLPVRQLARISLAATTSVGLSVVVATGGSGPAQVAAGLAGAAAYLLGLRALHMFEATDARAITPLLDGLPRPLATSGAAVAAWVCHAR
jgi:O-antigen/teichoic acid export membrane protein